MVLNRQSLARKPSLSTIDSVEENRPHPLSPLQQSDPLQPQNLHVSPEHYHSLRKETFFESSTAAGHNVWQNTSSKSNPGFPDPAMSSRPGLVRVPSTQTRYMEMLLHLDRIPRIYTILAGASTWILLASFLIIPGTFTSFKNSDLFKNAEDNDDDKSAVAKAIIDSAANVGLLWLSGALCVIGGFGCLFLWFRWRKNYVWLVNKVFFPALMNAFAGLLTTIVNVYTAQKGVWSITAKITAISAGCLIAVAGSLFAAYNFWMLEKVRDAHEAMYPAEELKV